MADIQTFKVIIEELTSCGSGNETWSPIETLNSDGQIIDKYVTTEDGTDLASYGHLYRSCQRYTFSVPASPFIPLPNEFHEWQGGIQLPYDNENGVWSQSSPLDWTDPAGANCECEPATPPSEDPIYAYKWWKIKADSCERTEGDPISYSNIESQGYVSNSNQLTASYPDDAAFNDVTTGDDILIYSGCYKWRFHIQTDSPFEPVDFDFPSAEFNATAGNRLDQTGVADELLPEAVDTVIPPGWDPVTCCTTHLECENNLNVDDPQDVCIMVYGHDDDVDACVDGDGEDVGLGQLCSVPTPPVTQPVYNFYWEQHKINECASDAMQTPYHPGSGDPVGYSDEINTDLETDKGWGYVEAGKVPMDHPFNETGETIYAFSGCYRWTVRALQPTWFEEWQIWGRGGLGDQNPPFPSDDDPFEAPTISTDPVIDSPPGWDPETCCTTHLECMCDGWPGSVLGDQCPGLACHKMYGHDDDEDACFDENGLELDEGDECIPPTPEPPCEPCEPGTQSIQDATCCPSAGGLMLVFEKCDASLFNNYALIYETEDDAFDISTATEDGKTYVGCLNLVHTIQIADVYDWDEISAAFDGEHVPGHQGINEQNVGDFRMTEDPSSYIDWSEKCDDGVCLECCEPTPPVQTTNDPHVTTFFGEKFDM